MIKSKEDIKNVLNLKSNFIKQSDIPTYENFSKLNFVHIPPRKSAVNQTNTKDNDTNVITDTKFEVPVKEKLLKIYKSYYKNFVSICQDVIDAKYRSIFDDVNNTMIAEKLMNQPFIRAIIFNTDQNANELFASLENYINNKYNDSYTERIIFICEEKFNDLKDLFTLLKVNDDRIETNNEKVVRLIVLRQIQKIDKLNLNLLITRLIDYNENPKSVYENIILFDVAYDTNSLYDKIKPNNLCKMVFTNIEIVPSRNIYQEILYKFIYDSKSNHLFIPKSKFLNKIVEYVTDHQISVNSFKNYFKFILIEYFLIGSWSRDEYLLYNIDMTKEDKLNESKLTTYFKKELYQIYGELSDCLYNEDDIKYLVDLYKAEKIDRDLYFYFYKKFEEMMVKLIKISDKPGHTTQFDKYKFFFDYFKIGDKTEDNRIKIIRQYFDKLDTKVDMMHLIDSQITPIFEEVIEKEVIKNEEYSQQYGDFILKLQKLTKDSGAKELMKALHSTHKIKGGFNQSQNDQDLNLPSTMTSKEIIDKFMDLLNRDLFKIKFFFYVSINEERKVTKENPRILLNTAKNYLKLNEVVNPNLNSVIIEFLNNFDKKYQAETTNKTSKKSKVVDDDLSDLEEPINAENFKENFKFIKLLRHFLILFAQLPIEFKLKFAFAEYLEQFGVDFEKKNLVQTMKSHFLYFCHIFYLLGLISRKRVKNDVFMKNYFLATDYFKNN